MSAGVGVAAAFATVEDAEAAFYDAFARADVNAMMSVWAEDEDIECVHPTGARLSGRRAVSESWQAIFSNFPGMEFHIDARSRFDSAGMTIHVVHEHIRVGRAHEFGPPVIATNAYRLTESGWRMVLHHASPSPAARKKHESAKTIH